MSSSALSHFAPLVIIAGGGPVGAGLAIELGQRGVPTLVIERYDRPQHVPKGQNLTQRTMEHFHFWGAERALRAARTIPPEYGIGGLTAYGTLLSGRHYDWLQRELVRPYYFTDNERLPQYATEAVLRQRANELPSVRFLTGWSVETFEQDADGVTVTAGSRDGGERRSWRAEYLVGCDGSRSVVRETAGIGQTLSDHDRLMALLVFRSTELDRLLRRFPGKSYYNVLHPDHAGYWQFFGRVDLDREFFFHAPVPPSARDGEYDFVGHLHRAVGAEFDVEFSHVGFWDLRFALADSYRAGRVFIAGDAAHSHPPYGGYGINTGFEDARNLGWKLAARLQGWGGEALLDSYSAERHAVFHSLARDFIAKAIETDRVFLERFGPERDAEAFDREWRARAEGAREEIGAYEPNYRGSPVVFGVGESGAAGRHEFRAEAGRHLAPLTLSSGANVYEVLGSGFTLLNFGSAEIAADFAEAAERLGVPLTVVSDAGGAAAEGLEERVALIRPDQFVAWAGEGAEAEAVLRRAAGLGSAQES